MTNVARKRIKRWGILATLGFLGSISFMRFLRGQPLLDDGDLLTALLIAAFLSTAIVLVESLAVPPTCRMKLIPAVLIRTVSYTLAAAGSVFLGVLLANVLQDGWDAARLRVAGLLETGEVFRGCVFGLLLVLSIVFFGSISQKLGPGVFWNWLIGRYHQPREERCVFMFLDLRNSTGLAERLGDARFSAFIRDLFTDITPALLDHEARVSHFIGDEVVLYWTIRKGAQPGPEFARCFFAVQNLLARLAPKYLAGYGVVPGFKAGAHWGTVIATEVGQIKSEIVFHGDVLNVASRLERLCGEEGTSLLVSGELASALASEEGLFIDDLGERQLKGKEQAIRVVSVRCALDI